MKKIIITVIVIFVSATSAFSKSHEEAMKEAKKCNIVVTLSIDESSKKYPKPFTQVILRKFHDKVVILVNNKVFTHYAKDLPGGNTSRYVSAVYDGKGTWYPAELTSKNGYLKYHFIDKEGKKYEAMVCYKSCLKKPDDFWFIKAM